MDDAPSALPAVQAARQGAIASAKPTRSAGMQYLYSYRFVFDHPNWGMNLLACSVCQLVPIVGPLVALGYQEDVIESLHRGDGEKYPAFDMNRLGYYLQRSLWPFVVALVLMLVLLPVAMLVMLVSVVGIGALASMSGNSAPLVLGVAIPLSMVVQFSLSVVINMALLPITLRAGLSQEFGQAFRLRWALGFLKRVWLEALLAMLFLSLTSIGLLAVGLFLLCVGMYPAIALVSLSWAHLQHQLYELYLARGGEPIPMKPPPVRVQPGYVATVPTYGSP
jgi:hypothetical protein